MIHNFVCKLHIIGFDFSCTIRFHSSNDNHKNWPLFVIIKIKLFIRLWSNVLSPQFPNNCNTRGTLIQDSPHGLAPQTWCNIGKLRMSLIVRGCKQTFKWHPYQWSHWLHNFVVLESQDPTLTFLITNVCNTLVCLLTLWLKFITNENKTKQNKIGTSMCFVTSTCEWEHVMPFIDHVLPSFKVKWFSSTEAPSTSYIINAILVITFVCLVMPCHVIKQTHTLKKKTRIMKHPHENLLKGITNVTSLPNDFTLTLIFVNSHTMRCWDR
jgi:hypothetical protein